MKKLITILAILATFILFSCENVINKHNTTTITFSIPKEVNRHISDTLLSSRSFTIDSEIGVSAILLNKDKTIDKKTKTTTVKELSNVSFLFDNICFGSNYKISIDISYKSSSIYKGESSNITVSETSLNPIVNIDINPVESTITYNLNGGKFIDSYPKKYFVLSNVILPVPTLEYKTFTGWVTEEGEEITELGQNNFLGNITLIATWIDNPKVGPVIFSSPNLLDKNDLITLSCPENPNASIYYTIDNSTPSKNSTLYKDPIPILDDVTIKAIAYKEGMKESNVSEMSYTVKKYNVTFDTNGRGGSSIENLTNVPKGHPVNLKTLSENGYNFDGWIDSKGKPVDSSYTVYETTTITALWSPISYNINYMNCDKSVKNDNPLTYTIEDVIKLNKPVKAGYIFNGWYTTENFDEKTSITNIENQTGELNLWAKWDTNSYNITYVGLEGATNNNPSTYNSDSPEIRLKDPIKNGYTFMGWFSDEKHSISDSTIPPNSTGNKTFYAKWEIITYSITYQTNEGQIVTLDSSPIRHSHVSPPTEFNINSPSLTLYPPAKDGYTGIWLNEGVETSTIPSGTYNHVTLTVGDVWNPITYYINFNANGGTGDMPRQEITYGVNTQLNENQFTYEGYKWVGWQTSSTGGSIKTNSYNECINNGASIDVYAKWVEAIPPEEVTNLEAITNDSSIQLNWTNPSSSDLAYVNITCTSHPDLVIPRQSATPSSQGTYTVSSLTNGTEYTFNITTQDSNENISVGKEIKQYPMLPLHLQDEPLKRSSTYPSTYIFGVYPQTIKAKDVNVSQTTTSILNWTCYYGSDGYYYVKGTPEKNCAGKKFSDNTPMNYGTEYYFKLEPITWINSTYRPNNDHLCIMYYTQKLIYNSVWGEPSNSDASSGESMSQSRNTYPTSIVSDNLNSDFCSKGFSQEMLKTIYEDETLKTILDNRTEKFWLMDFRDYRDVDRAFHSNQDRDAQSTDYAFLTDTYNDGNTVDDVVQGTRDFNSDKVGIISATGEVPSTTDAKTITAPVDGVYPYRVATFFTINQ